MLTTLILLHALEAPGAVCSDTLKQGVSLLQSKHDVRVGVTPQADLFYCWAIVSLWEHTIAELHTQLQGCDGYGMFSNFSDPTRNIIQLFDDDMHVAKPNGFANVTLKFASAWAYVAREGKKTGEYDWYVKVDADSFFRPQFLPQMVAGLDSSLAIGLGVNGLLQAPVEVISNGAIFSRTPFFNDPISTIESDACFKRGCWWEDVWINKALKRSGVHVVDAHMIDGCLALVYNNYRNHRFMPKCGRQIYDEDGNIAPTIFQKPTYCTRNNFGIGNRRRKELPRCIHQNVIAIHPIKNATIFKQLQLLNSNADVMKMTSL